MRKHKRKPSRIARAIDPKHAQRAAKVQMEQVGPYLDSIVTYLHQALDDWRFRTSDPEQVELALDAFLALWTEVQLRRSA